jgi:mRNA interferase RelE/StbE
MPRKAGEPLYKIRVHRRVITEDSKRFDESTKEKIKRKCKELLSHAPDKIGEPLQFALKGYRKLKIFDEYRIIYKVERTNVLVFILAVGIRRDDEIYREALKGL